MAKSSWQQQREREQREALRTQREAERLAAQQKREAERAQAQAEREQRAQHIEQQKEEAERLTTQANDRIAALSSVLGNGLQRSCPLDFDRMRVTFQASDFRPGVHGKEEPAPQWEQFSPRRPGFLSRLFGSSDRREREEREAQLRFEQECAAHKQREEARLVRLRNAEAAHLEKQAKQKRRRKLITPK